MAEFDVVAPVYDATRQPPSEEELSAVAAALGGERRILEAGVGTGRYSVPLSSRGLSMTGVDISTEMLRRARQKGLDRLLRANLLRLPFPDGSFDAALIVHVLQLLPDPFAALAELTRVTQDRVVAVFPDHGGEERGRREGFRRRYRELAAERGYPLPPRPRYWQNGARLVRACPPDTESRVEVSQPIDPERARAWIDQRAFASSVNVPEDVHRSIVEQIRAERGNSTVPGSWGRHRVLHVASWRASQRPGFLAHVGEPNPPVADPAAP